MKLKLIQAGVGGMGRAWWTNAVKPSPDFECVALVDIDAIVLNEAGDALSLPNDRRFGSLQDALKVQADALLTVTPPPIHAEHARLAFEHGLHVLSEKPVAQDLSHAKRMVQQAAAANRQLMIAQNYRYSATIQTLKRTFDAKPLGDFGHGHLDFYIPADFGENFRKHMPHVLLVDMAIHHIDLIRYITGRNITRVLAHSFNPPWSWYDRDAALKMILELEGGGSFSYGGDWSGRGKPTTWNGDWRLQCADGSIHLESDQISLARCEKWAKDPTRQTVAIDAPPTSGQVELLRRFADAIRTGRPAETSGADNLWSFAAVMAGVQSATEQRWVDVQI